MVTFKGYEIVQRIDAGGMAEVFMVRPVGSSATPSLALKRLLPHFRDIEDVAALFRREAQMSASLDHPNIVKVIDHGDDYLVMELIYGNDLRNTGALEPYDVVHIADEILAALEYCHARGVIHRDLTPANVIFDEQRRTRVLDFGVYLDIGAHDSVARSALAGKYAYLAPEVALGKPVDPRADLFSVGVLTWELLTGHRLFRGRNDAETITNVVDMEASAPSARNRLCPAALDPVVLRALSKSPDDRFPESKSMRTALREAAAATGIRMRDR